MIFPTVHLNGTNRGVLIEQLLAARDAVNNAMEALRNAAPNGRDYYPQGSRMIYQATDEHVARMLKLEEVHRELTLILEYISGL